MKLDTWMTENKQTDEGFGKRIGRSKSQVNKYRHGLAVPRKDPMKRIFEETGGQVRANDFNEETS